MISIPKKYWKPLITIKIINIATVSIPRDFILDDESDDVSVDEDDENFAFDNPENKPLDDELVLEFVSPKEKNMVMKINKTPTTMIITLGFDNISLKKLYVSVATFPKPVTKFVFVFVFEFELELLIIYYINQIISY
jgi:hypothetical protein